MLNFICFGSGSSGNCYYLYTEYTGILIDVGVGLRKLKKSFHDFGLTLADVNYILLTHDHADHVKSVGKLSHDLNVPVYATQSVFEGIDGNYCVKNKVDRPLRRCLEKTTPLQLGDLLVEPFEVPHDSRDNVGFVITYEGRKFCLATDVGHVTPEIEERVREAHFLVVESNHCEEMLLKGNYPVFLKERVRGPRGHLSNEECGQLLAEHATPALEHVWLCHLSDENNHPVIARKTNEEILRSYGIIAGVDFKLDVLDRLKPSLLYTLVE